MLILIIKTKGTGILNCGKVTNYIAASIPSTLEKPPSLKEKNILHKKLFPFRNTQNVNCTINNNSLAKRKQIDSSKITNLFNLISLLSQYVITN